MRRREGKGQGKDEHGDARRIKQERESQRERERRARISEEETSESESLVAFSSLGDFSHRIGTLALLFLLHEVQGLVLVVFGLLGCRLQRLLFPPTSTITCTTSSLAAPRAHGRARRSMANKEGAGVRERERESEETGTEGENERGTCCSRCMRA
jgi:hypothetical protein